MAKKILYYTAVTGGRCYIFFLPDGSTRGIQYERGTVVHLAADYAETEQYSRCRVIFPMEGWLHKGYITNLEPVYSDEPEAGTPPSKIVLNPATLTLTVAGGSGTGYQIQYRERSIEKYTYTEWQQQQNVDGVGSATISVSVNPGKARQFRARTIGEVDSEWVVCASELLSAATSAYQKQAYKRSVTLHVFDSELNYKGRIENWQSLTWDEEYQGKGGFTLTIPDTTKNAKLIQRGCFLYRNDRNSLMMAVSIERNGENSEINIGGYTALHMLEHRVVHGKHKISNIESGIYTLISENLRGLPIKCASAVGYEDSIEEEEYECPELMDAVLTLIREGDLGIKAVFDSQSREITLQVYRGNDRTYGNEDGHVFSTEFGNLYSVIVTEDDEELKNVAVVVCGESGSEKTVFVYEAAEGLTGLDRRELLVSGEAQGTKEDEKGNEVERTAEEWEKAMLDLGKQELTDHNFVQTFEVKPRAENYGVYYFLGDKVTCKSSRYNLRFDARITQVKESFDANGCELTMTLGEPTINYYRR